MLISQLFNVIIIGHGLRRGFPFINKTRQSQPGAAGMCALMLSNTLFPAVAEGAEHQQTELQRPLW